MNKEVGTEINPKLAAVMAAVQKSFGKESIMCFTGKPEPVPVFSSGSIALDGALGIGGYPKGRIIELYGPESSGKTTLALHAIAQCQKEGGLTAYVDAEHALDVNYARRMGVCMDKILISQPDCGEQALDVVEALARSAQLAVIVVDSVAALVPKAEIDGEMGDNHVGLHARLMSRAMRKLATVAHQTGTTIIFINQIRMKIGVMFGSPETTTGGNALKFFASVRMDVRRIATIKNGEVGVGLRTRVKIVKNKMAPPFKQAEMDVLWASGIDHIGELLDLSVDAHMVSRAGPWYYKPNGEKLGQGRVKAMEALAVDMALQAELLPAAREQAMRTGVQGATE